MDYVEISWTHPQVHLCSFNIYHKTNITQVGWNNVITNVVGTNKVKIPVKPGKHFFAVTAVDRNTGLESDFARK